MRLAALTAVVFMAACATHSAPPAADGTPARLDLARVLASQPFAAMLAQYDADAAVLRRSVASGGFAGTHAAIDAASSDLAKRLDAGSRRLRGVRVEPVTLPRPGGRSPHDFAAAVAPFRQAALARAERAASLRAAQMREREATIAYGFERAHGGRRLLLELKLRDLHLDAVSRKRYRAELASLDAQEAALVRAARARDDAELAAYRTHLQSQAAAGVSAMSGDVAAHARAARTVDLQSPAKGWLPQWRDDTGAPARFAAARDDLTKRLLALRDAGDAGRTSAKNEIAALQRERDALRAQIVASAEARAAKIAAARHLGRVYTSAPPAGARDLTADVLESYSVSTGS